MKITKQRLKDIIKEELEFVGAEIDQFAQPEVEVDSSHVAELLGTPEGTMIAKIMARKIIDQFASFPELADAIEGIDRDEVTARVVAAMRDNRLYDPMEERAEELEEKFYGGAYDRSRYARRKKGEPGEQSANQGSGRPDSATRSANAGARQGGDPSKSPLRRGR